MKSLVLGVALALLLIVPETLDASGGYAFSSGAVIQRQRSVQRAPLLGRFRSRQRFVQQSYVAPIAVQQVYAQPIAVQKQFVQKQFVQKQFVPQQVVVRQKVVQQPVIVQEQVYAPAVQVEAYALPSCSLNSCGAAQLQQLEQYNTVLPQCQ